MGSDEYQTLEYGLAKKRAKKHRAVKLKLTPRKTMLAVAFTCSPPPPPPPQILYHGPT